MKPPHTHTHTHTRVLSLLPLPSKHSPLPSPPLAGLGAKAPWTLQPKHRLYSAHHMDCGVLGSRARHSHITGLVADSVYSGPELNTGDLNGRLKRR